MDVFVIPVGRDRYELYYESTAPIADAGAGESSSGWIARLRERFALMVRQAEDKEASGTGPDASEGWWDRLQTRLLAWVAERIAEQRLLWNLRRESEARLIHPVDLTFDQALTLVRRMLKRDHDRHRIWFAVNGILLILSAILAIVPGPNMVAYYFAFRVVGHWLSMRGAAQGLHRVQWNGDGNARLSDLRAALTRDHAARTTAIHDIAGALGLAKLPAFIERVATR